MNNSSACWTLTEDNRNEKNNMSHKNGTQSSRKLTDEQAIELLSDPCNGKEAAKKYGISPCLVSNIRSGQAYEWIDRSKITIKSKRKKYSQRPTYELEQERMKKEWIARMLKEPY